MTQLPLIAVTRRLPEACEQRLKSARNYSVRLGDDDVIYTPEKITQHAAGAVALIVWTTEVVNADVIAALPDTVKVIATVSAGFEHIDIAAARARGVRVTNAPDVLTDATADIALLLILGATRRASEGERMMRSNNWKGLRPIRFLGSQITGKRLGLVGMGRIGVATAKRAQACGMQVLYHNRREAPPGTIENAIFVPRLEDLLPKSDVLSLHCPLTPETRGILNAENIALLPKGAVVVNTARGGLIDDEALISALKSGHLYAAGLDVYANEPAFDQRYRTLENVFLLPHVGSGTVETRTAMGMLAIDNVEAVLTGREPRHPLA
jgi:lactate dehydrogenase-like 2-hydroxyacid dehydrogenase